MNSLVLRCSFLAMLAPCWIPLSVLLGAGFNVLGDPMDGPIAPAAAPSEMALSDSSFTIEPAPVLSRDWSVQAGISVISANDIGEVLSGGFDRAHGDAGGLNYSLTLSWTARRFEIPFRESTLRPQFEPYFRLTLVDENSRSIFPDYNAGIGFRWVDFPWNKWIETTLYMGLGLSYSSRVYTADRERHPDEDRSHLKFDWPIQLTFALPRWPQHQLMLFNDHQSGGHIFDEGGVNAFGIGYRFEF